jgi:hypothetical protein
MTSLPIPSAGMSPILRVRLAVVDAVRNGVRNMSFQVEKKGIGFSEVKERSRVTERDIYA